MQAAPYYLSPFMDGVLQILLSEYLIRDALRLHSHVITRGSGEKTIFKMSLDFWGSLQYLNSIIEFIFFERIDDAHTFC